MEKEGKKEKMTKITYLLTCLLTPQVKMLQFRPLLKAILSSISLSL